MRSNAKHLTHDAVIAHFEPYLYPLDVSYQNVNEVSLNALFYVSKVVLWLVGYKKEMVDVDLKMFRFVMPDVPLFVMKFMDNWSKRGLSKSIDVGFGYSLETPTFNAIAAISWLGVRKIRLPLGHRVSACLTSAFSLPWRNIKGTSEVFPKEVTILEPIFPTLVRTFYSRVTYGHGRPIISTVRGVQIKLDPKSICRILDIAPVGLRAFLIDSIMMGRRIDVGYVMMMHMMACCESSTDFDTYDERSLGRMKFEKGLDGS
ncbi:hypothetical protein AAG906_016310 [Vitis piasezkii]